MQQVLNSSSKGTFSVISGEPGRKFDRKRHRLLHNFPGTEMVLHGVISGVVRFRDGEKVCFSKEVVVAVVPIPKTASQASESVLPEAQADRS